jgi:hypothetical protein
VATLFQFSLYWRASLPTQLSSQYSHGIGERPSYPRPRLSPGEVFHTPAARALQAPRAVAQFQRQLPHGQMTPPPLFSDIVHFRCRQTLLRKSRFPSCPMYTPACSRQSFPPWSRYALSNPMFSDKGLYEQIGSDPFVFRGRKHEISPIPGCHSNACPARNSKVSKGFNADNYFLDSP